MGRLSRGAAGIALAMTAVGVPPAYASCAQDSGPAGSSVIFVGSVEQQRRGFTLFSVSQVWAGPDLAPKVWIQTGQEQPPWPVSIVQVVGSSGDAELLSGHRYVVGASRGYRTGACSVSEFTSATGPTRTENGSMAVRDPVPDGAQGADPPLGPIGQGLWTAGFLAALGGAAVLIRRHRARTRQEQSGADRCLGWGPDQCPEPAGGYSAGQPVSRPG
jgi:hypothetical protein